MYSKVRLIRKIIALTSTCFMLTFANPSMAITEIEAIKQLNDLVTAKRFQEAYDLANEYVMDFGGEPRFDYLMGLAAYSLNQFEESVFAFERAVIVKPKWQQARFQLAKAYFRADNQAASRAELIKLKGESTDPNFTAQLDRYIAQVDDSMMSKRRQFKQILSITGGYDTNVNSGTTEDFALRFDGVPVILSDESKEISDSIYNLSYQATYQEPFSQKSLLIGTLGLFRIELPDTPIYERTMADVGLTWQDELDEFTYQVGAFYRPMQLDDVHYHDQYGYFTNWTLPLNINWAVRLDTGFGKVDNRTSHLLDVRDVYATVTAKYSVGRWQHTMAANHTDIRSVFPTTKHNSYHYYKLDYKTAYILGQNQVISFEAQWQKFNYDVVHPAFGKVREEDFARVGLGWQYLYNEWIMFQANYRHSTKNSNVSVYSYDRDEYILGITMQF